MAHLATVSTRVGTRTQMRVASCRYPRAVTRSNARRVVAFKETDKEAKQDWRVMQMVSLAHTYYDSLWSKGNVSCAAALMDEEVVYKDMVLSPGSMVVGPHAVKKVISETRQMYPDLWMDVEQMGFCDSNHIFVQWTAHATNLGNAKGHKATHHHSMWQGMDLVGFSDDRQKIREVTVFRQLTTEEKQELQGLARTQDVVSFEDRYQISLPRLHWEPNELRVPE